jgi:hypothetical protein
MPAGFLAPIGSSGSIFAFFGVIDIAVRSGVQFHHGPGGKFNAWRGNSARSEIANSYFPKQATRMAGEKFREAVFLHCF